MGRSQNITTENDASVSTWVNKIPDEKRQKDVTALIALFTHATGFPPKMWGAAIVGFGSAHYVYDSGREGNTLLAGLASRSNAIVLYLSSAFEKRDELLAALGKHKTGKACIYIRSLSDVDQRILTRMIKLSVAHTRKHYVEAAALRKKKSGPRKSTD